MGSGGALTPRLLSPRTVSGCPYEKCSMVRHITTRVVKMLPMAMEDEKTGYSLCHLCVEDLSL